VVASPAEPQEAPSDGEVKGKLVRGGIVVAVLVVLVIAVIGLLPGLNGVRSAISAASPGWVVVAAGIQAVGVAGAVVFVELVFAEVPHRLARKMGGRSRRRTRCCRLAAAPWLATGR
jgi:hypothetical protein